MTVADNALYRAKKAGRDRIFWERRRWIRFTPASLKIKLMDKEAKVVNISKKGALLLFPEELKEKEVVCYIQLNDKEMRKIVCQVIHQSKKEEMYQIGVYFAKDFLDLNV